MRMSTEIKMSVQRMVCTACGSEANASCNCGKPYVPAKQRAAEAIKANPQKSNRAIADEIGVSKDTVRKVRETTGDQSPVERVGLDGKTRKMPTLRVVEEEPDDTEADIEADIEPANYRGAFLIRADQAKQFASYSGPVTPEIIAMARQVAMVWNNLAAQLEKSL